MFAQLPYLYLFSPMSVLCSYAENTKLCDASYFKAIKEIDYFLIPQVFQFDLPMRVNIVVSSNDILLAKKQLCDVLDLTDRYVWINTYLAVGAGHDLYTVLPSFVNVLFNE